MKVRVIVSHDTGYVVCDYAIEGNVETAKLIREASESAISELVERGAVLAHHDPAVEAVNRESRGG